MILNNEKIQEMAIGSEIGNIYYKYFEDLNDFVTYRIIRIQNEDTVTCIINGDEKQIRKFKLKELRENYNLLLSNIILLACKVLAATTSRGVPIYDIMISGYERNSGALTYTKPDLVCRQCLSDIFYEPYCDSGDNPMVGVSVSKHTIPAGFEMSDLNGCDDFLEYKIINAYKTDTLQSLMKIIGNDWDSTLEDLLKDHCKAIMGNRYQFIEDKNIPDTLHGYCKTVELLLKTNNFMYDFYQLLGITEVSFKIDYPENIYATVENEYNLPIDQKECIQEIYQINMEKTIVLPFEFSVDLSLVKIPYVLIMDNTGTLYFVGFTRSKNEYVRTFDMTVENEMKAIQSKLSNAVALYNKYSE